LPLLLVVVAAVAAYLLLPGGKPTSPPRHIVGGALPSPGSADLQGFRVTVDELRIDLPIVEGDGWTAPLYRAAHYPGMKLPGQGGRSLLYAHARDGMFGSLLLHGAVGQHVEVTRPGSPTLRYLVQRFLSNVDPADASWLDPVNHEELVLLTCTSYDPNGPRVIAVAKPV
jgi:LPXTG-site transpeptidase (sortase) family protein